MMRTREQILLDTIKDEEETISALTIGIHLAKDEESKAIIEKVINKHKERVRIAKSNLSLPMGG